MEAIITGPIIVVEPNYVGKGYDAVWDEYYDLDKEKNGNKFPMFLAVLAAIFSVGISFYPMYENDIPKLFEWIASII